MKTFLFIGSNSDIAQETLKLLESNGNKVICISRNHIDEVENNLIGNPVLNDLPEIDVEIDGLVYFPGSITLKPFRSLKQVDFLKELEINVLGAINSIQKYSPKLKEGSSIVLFSTVAVQIGMPFHSAVSVAKGAVEGLTRALAAEFSPKIRVNCIAPSLTQTKMAEKFLSTPEKQEAAGQRHPLKTVGKKEDMANAVTFLLNDTSKWMTGQILHIDGGMSSLRI
ncbi:MAG: SDR family NAD(P)-dependent oxidoreductase [Crocinitomicaceae bacterium]|jgi:NAD(P)-dependent dehydrogenase (short-subunit alcohol dehydrogenase family)